jgi:hypothetical protein
MYKSIGFSYEADREAEKSLAPFNPSFKDLGDI